MVDENYEALGRYIAAKEQAERFAIDRDSHLRTIYALAGRVLANLGNDFLANSCNPVEIQESLDKAIEANQNMLAAVNEANTQASACGKRPIEIGGKTKTIAR